MNNNWGNKSLAFTSTDEISEYHQSALNQLLVYLKVHSPFYQKKLASFEGKGFILTDLPTTSKEELQLHNGDFLCIPKQSVAEYTTTSGTLGQPVTIALSQNDLDRLAYNESCTFELMEVSCDNTVQLMLTLDKQFMAGMAYYQGARAVGAAVVRTGPGVVEAQLRSIQHLGVDTLVAVPSFLLKIIETAKTQGLDLNQLSPKKVLAIGESLYDEDGNKNVLYQRILADWNLKLYSTYAATEMQTAFTECGSKMGLHANPELLIVEFLNEDGIPVAPGEIGEVTITTLGVEAMPLLRYRTGDLVKHEISPCQCGRNSIRIGAVLGRKKQLVKYKGTSVYPAAIFEILNEETWIENYLIEIHQNSHFQDDLIIKIASNSDHLEQKILALSQRFRAKIRVVPTLELCSIETILGLQFPNGSRKPLKIIDYR